MQLRTSDLINSHKGKTAIVCGLGNSLNENLAWIEEQSANNKAEYATFCCNLYYAMTDIDADFWLVSNPQNDMQLEAMAEAIESFKGVFIYSDINNKSGIQISENVKYVKLSEEIGFSVNVAEYCGEKERAYKGVDSVVIHLIALAVVCGCKEVLIAGVDLDYSKGYVDGRQTHPKGVDLGLDIMPLSRENIIRDILTLKRYAKNIGVEIRSINPDTVLYKRLKEQE